MEITFENLPKAVTQLSIELYEIKRLILEMSNEKPTETDRWYDLNELCNYLPNKPAKQTLYGKLCKGLIPGYKGPDEKEWRFLKSEIDIWLKQSKKKTHSEIDEEVDFFLADHKKRKK